MSIIASSNFFTARKSRSQYQIERSLRLDSASSAYLHRTPSVAGNQKKYTISIWVKRCGLLASAFDVSFLGAGDGTTWGISGVGAFGGAYNGKMMIRDGGVNVGYWDVEFRDPSAWYHFVLAIDTDQATPANRNRLYVNGVEQPAPTASLGLSVSTNINSTNIHSIGTFNLLAGPTPYVGYYANALITEYHFIDGSQLTPSAFGENDLITGVWKPKKYSGTYGTNGFYLKFADNSGTTSTTLGKDSSGNGNNWTPNNFSVTAGAGNDSLIDTPTPYADGGNGRGNYSTLNPLFVNNTYPITYSNGNLDATRSGGGQGGITNTLGMASGKWYWEVVYSTYGRNFGITTNPAGSTVGSEGVAGYNGGGGTSIGLQTNGVLRTNGTAGSTYTSWTTGDVMGIALDMDGGNLYIYKNGTAMNSGSPVTTGLTGSTWFFITSVESGASVVANFGQRAFAYTPPSGFKALNTQNLPEPSIKKPSSFMDVVLYTGTGSALTPTSSLGFSPDLVWIKGRSGATDHALYDAVRGVQLDLVSNSTAAETTQAQGLTAFNSNGFTVGTLAKLNTNTATYCAWCWDAGGAGSSNTAGSITSTVSANATAGFSIVTYTGNGTTGATVGHGLGVSPEFIIWKRRNSTSNWTSYNKTSGNGNTLYLDLTNGNTASSYLNSTTPSSTVITLATNTDNNGNGGTYVAYCFSEVAGFSKFGSYTGNASSDGPFVFCGFRPRWVLIKSSSNITHWYIFDTARNTYNLANQSLRANLAHAENTGGNEELDIVSNGFKMRNASSSFNISSYTYIFAAYAESPFKFALAR